MHAPHSHILQPRQMPHTVHVIMDKELPKQRYAGAAKGRVVSLAEC